jgi:phosphohistidine phosphatase
MREFFTKPEFILCSDARRTQETLRYFLPTLEIDSAHYVLEHRIYEADLSTLISLVESIPDVFENVMLIGHNPGLSLLTAYYTGEFVDIPTCAWTEMVFNVDSWSALSRDTAILRSFEYPKKEV